MTSSKTSSSTSKTGDNADGPTPYGPQLPFITRDARYYAFISGIGAGKTAAGICRLLKNVRDWNEGYTGFVVAPTVPSLRTTVIPELDKWGVLEQCEFNRTEKRLDFPNGSTVFLDSADNDRKIQRLRGPSISWFWIDEAATVDKRAWDILVGRLRDGDYRNAFVTTTPKGYNWVYERFVEDNPDDVRAITGVESHANPHLPSDYQEITDEYSGQFHEQEVQGKFVDYEGLIYPWFDQDNLTDAPPEQYDEVIYGVDWGYNSPSVILAIVRAGDAWVVTEEFYERRCTVNDLSRYAHDMQDRWGPGRFYCDDAQPENIEAFQRDGLDARPAEKNVLPGIQHVASLRDELRVVESCQMVRNEFGQYQWQDDDDEDKPVKQNDHAMDSLRYALFTHDQRGGGDLWAVEF